MNNEPRKEEFLIWGEKGQNLIEYALVVSLVSAAFVAMSTYVFRSVQATQKMVETEFGNDSAIQPINRLQIIN